MKEKRINPHFYLCRRIIASVITLLICVAVLAVPNANKNEKLFNQKNASAIGWVGGEIVEYYQHASPLLLHFAVKADSLFRTKCSVF